MSWIEAIISGLSAILLWVRNGLQLIVGVLIRCAEFVVEDLWQIWGTIEGAGQVAVADMLENIAGRIPGFDGGLVAHEVWAIVYWWLPVGDGLAVAVGWSAIAVTIITVRIAIKLAPFIG